MTPEGGVRVTASTGELVTSYSVDGSVPQYGDYTGEVKSISFNFSIGERVREYDFKSYLLTNTSLYIKDYGLAFNEATDFNNVFENWTTAWNEVSYPANMEIVFDFANNVWYMDSEIKGTINTSIIEFFNFIA